MANQIVVTQSGNVQVSIEPTPNVQVQISRAAINTLTNVPTANTANTVTNNAQPNITSVGTLTGLVSSGNITAPFFLGNVVGNISGNLVVPGTNTAVLFNQLGNAGASDALKFDYSANVLTANGNIVANYFIGNGSQLTGLTVASANYANFAGNVVNNNQPNITSVGTLTGLSIAGNIIPTSNIAYDLGNNTNRFNDLYLAGNTIYLGAQEISANASGISFTGNLSGNATGLSNITGANVTGEVPFAATANSVAVANVSGIGNIATVNLDGNASNILFGNGVFSAAPSTANANYANFAGTAFNVSGSNVSGAVANATYANNAGNANIANSATVANSANSVAVANVSGIGNIATVNLDGNVSNVLSGNGSFIALPSVSANANYANFAGTAFNVSGSNVSGTVANATYADSANTANSATVANSANSVAVANVSGIGNIATINLDGNVSNVLSGNGSFVALPTVSANANYANFAGTVITNAQPNITSVGTLTTLAVSGNATIGNITSVDSVTFDTANIGPGAVAQLTWNDGDGTLDLGLKGGNVTLQVGQQQYARVHNNAANTLVKGEVVYVTGAAGNRVAVSRAQANAEATSTGTLGFVAESITAGSEGFVITSGALYKIDTLGYTAGNTVYLSPSVAGGWTTTKPVAPDQLVVLGWIERVSATVGSIYIKVDNGYELDELHNVLITSPVAGQALVYNSSNLWVNGISNVANNANYANFAGDVVNSSQPNITSVGNLPYLQVSNSANSTGVIRQTSAGNVTFTTSAANTATFQITTQYHPNNAVGYPSDRTIRSRGNVTTPTAVVNGDRILSRAGHGFNGNTNPLSVAEAFTIVGLNANASALWTGGQWNITTGNPQGNSANQDSLTWQNQLIFTNSGALQINPGTVPNVSAGQSVSPVIVTNYGLSTTDLAGAGGFNQQKARGNREALLSVQPNDTVGRVNMWGHNGTAYQSARPAALIAQVDNSYVANATVIPLNMSIRTVNSSNVSVDTTFFGNGTAQFPGNINASYFIGNGSSLTDITGGNVTGEVPFAAVANSVAVANVSGIGDIATINLNYTSTDVLYGDGVFGPIMGLSPGGSNTELQYNLLGTFAGISNVTYDGTTLSLGNVSNINISGGTNGYVLQTNGSGNLSWVAQSGGSSVTDFTPSFLLGGM